MEKTTHINQLHSTEPRWFAVRTRVKSEKFVQRMLEKKGIVTYLPLQRLLRRYARSTRLTEKPLINCYVFVQITKADYVVVLETENVSGFVRFNKSLIAIPETEMDLLRRISLDKDLDISALPYSLELGDPIEIRAGHLSGLKGTIVKAEGKRHFQVHLERLGYSLLITIDAAFLQKANLPAFQKD